MPRDAIQSRHPSKIILLSRRLMPKRSTRELWAMKLAGTLPPSKVRAPNPGRVGRRPSGIILGIDPSLRATGLAVVNMDVSPPKLLASATLKLKATASMPDCLAYISKSTSEMIERFAVTAVALEQTIFVQNVKTALILGAARGAAITAAATLEKPVFEYPPLRIKQAVLGYGRASKHQIAHTVKQMLDLDDVLAFDEADAAGVALCHAYTH